MLNKRIFQGKSIFGKRLPVVYKGEVLGSSCLRHKRLLNENVRVTCVTPIGHVQGLLRKHAGVEFLLVNKVYESQGFDYRKTKPYLKPPKYIKERLKKVLHASRLRGLK